MTAKIDILRKQVLNSLTKSKSLILRDKVETLISNKSRYVPLVTNYDYKQIKYNGLRSYLCIVDKFIEKINDDLVKRNNDTSTQRLSLVADLLLTESRLIDTVIHPNESSLEKIVAEQSVITQDRQRALLETGFFWLEESVLNHTAALHYLIALSEKNYWAVFNKNRRHEVVSKSFSDANVNDIKKVFELAESTLLNKFVAKVFPVEYVERKQLEIQSELEIGLGEVNEKRARNELKIQIIRNGRSDQLDGVVVLHYHGGGFIGLKPIGHENWLRRLAKSLPGVTVVSPYYRLAPQHKYPAALQDCVDTYQALTGQVKSNAEDILGFKPKQVIVIGDSAGGNLSIAVGRALYAAKLKAPPKILSLFPVAQCNITISNPSRALMFTDNILPATYCLEMINAYSPSGNVDYSSDRRPWFKRGFDVALKRAQELEQHSRDDEFYNLTAGKLDGFEESKVIFIPCEFDPLLDDSIDLASRMPKQENVEIYVAQNVPHGFNFIMSHMGIAATNTVFDKLKGLIGSA